MSFDLTPLSDLTPSSSDLSSDMNPTTPEHTLKSFQHHAPCQTEIIESLLDPSRYLFQDRNDIDWVELWQSAWDKDPRTFEKTEVVERGRNPINDSRITAPPVRDVMVTPEIAKLCWNFGSKFAGIFIRDDYKEAEEFVISRCGVDAPLHGVLVVGQPGIGLSPS